MSFVKILEDPGLPRRSGKTIMLAMHYVQLVLDNPGKQVAISDHHITVAADRNLFDLVRAVLYTLGIEHTAHAGALTITSSNQIRRVAYPEADLCIRADDDERWETSRRSRPSNVIY